MAKRVDFNCVVVYFQPKDSKSVTKLLYSGLFCFLVRAWLRPVLVFVGTVSSSIHTFFERSMITMSGCIAVDRMLVGIVDGGIALSPHFKLC